ncbi:hypothetical protein PMM47T1_00060 [Pseudomonas sp. M47T1]|uniref:DUF3142 domain-containing protein n=1 Tax=Pseudomonas sp. M47T1 TaxID=1179778 RepID=UPI0002606AC7|nr:DUF3142 domain-containing protein [Pseudomonas sp. M47T1]EIK98386.1 hypothetical protein PMM47T1_00060 [Pseudomonas sp. M47T1]
MPLSLVRLALATLLLTIAQDCSRPPVVLPNDAYIWQRQWTPALVAAVQSNTDIISHWRVLAAQADANGQWQTTAPDWAALKASGKPIIAVIRIDGQLARFDEKVLLQQVESTLQPWRASGVPLAGIEIDHDCATARLPAYAHWLASLRATLQGNEHLSITALPTWLNSNALDAVLAQVDEAVLQVHAVQNPRVGLFDPQAARTWLDTFAAHMHKPWRVALPAYGSRVAWDRDGRVVSIESERAMLVTGMEAHELMADPQNLQDFTRQLAADPPRGLAGIVWFRLPTEQDSRAWSPATWRAVLTHAPIDPVISAQLRSTDDPQLFDLVLANTGVGDGTPPATIKVSGRCAAADAINGYFMERNADGLVFQAREPGLLRPGRQRPIGWLRCEQGKESLHVES